MKKLMTMTFVCLVAACALDDVDPTDSETIATDAEEIIGGTPVDGWSCVLGLLIRDQFSSSGSLCTCTAVNRYACLTAAHCVDPRIIGSGKAIEFLSGPQGARTGLLASSRMFHPRWNPMALFEGYDFGVLHSIDPLPSSGCLRGNVDVSLPVTLVGYGSNTHDNTGARIKREVTVSIAMATPRLFRSGDSSAQICHGDSGGPAFQRQSGMNVAVGVASFGTDQPPEVCFGGGYHVRIDSAADWIDQNTSCGNGVCQPEIGETMFSCEPDCGFCGDGQCSRRESPDSCAADCRCGNGICESDESSASCILDCQFPDCPYPDDDVPCPV